MQCIAEKGMFILYQEVIKGRSYIELSEEKEIV